ncbi:MAG: hypothetical protein JOZ78_08340 [Chroococcidiopsidaceae cyanobacterium CP_BM_ER_R8_30]|nr:hypothetical protein [Chroococcidiopsidaceae cyanobacterium CP_BM_ER_R8_30]
MAQLRNGDNAHLFKVVHPLDDVERDQKKSPENLGRIRMTPSVRISLAILRGYLLIMIVLVIYRVFDLAGAFGHH